jgi:hypothetical protein
VPVCRWCVGSAALAPPGPWHSRTRGALRRQHSQVLSRTCLPTTSSFAENGRARCQAS